MLVRLAALSPQMLFHKLAYVGERGQGHHGGDFGAPQYSGFATLAKCFESLMISLTELAFRQISRRPGRGVIA